MDVPYFNNDQLQYTSLLDDGEGYIDPASESSLQCSSMSYSDHNGTQLILQDHNSYRIWDVECNDHGYNSKILPSILDPVYDPSWHSYVQNTNAPLEESSKLTIAEDTPERCEETTKRVNSVSNHDKKESSDDEWTVDNNSSDDSTITNVIEKNCLWTPSECKRLTDAVGIYGNKHNWKEIAAHVGTRDVSQCFNKWKNSLCKKKKRWNKEATIQLKQYLERGYDLKKLQELMPEYTYIQIYQQIERWKRNFESWKEWEIEKLIELKMEGKLSETEIGRCLNNRHRDSVKSMWNRIKKSYKY